MAGKTCTKCGRTLPLSRFSKHSQKKDGLRPDCKDCRNAKNREYYRSNRRMVLSRQKAYADRHKDERRDYHKSYYEQNKGSVLAKNANWKMRNRADYTKQQRIYTEQNRKAANERARRWARANPEKRKIAQLHANSLRRTRTKSGASSKDIARWLSRQPGTCYYCGCNCEGGMEIDHFYPLAKGGTHEISNLRVSCRSCNRRKHARDPHEFMASLAAGNEGPFNSPGAPSQSA